MIIISILLVNLLRQTITTLFNMIIRFKKFMKIIIIALSIINFNFFVKFTLY